MLVSAPPALLAAGTAIPGSGAFDASPPPGPLISGPCTISLDCERAAALLGEPRRFSSESCPIRFALAGAGSRDSPVAPEVPR
ncbi:hypothetical protein PF010_g31709 [Phytophthora fragariae]|uniref:Uncharacterized protein n=1 Tax=Phytophthora fragariae TaxID=53985 RepID=A0A6A3WTQ7_9STRA|nr:hypothetical protein PF010_g31709 [Phytophthora fragariae]KAE9190584.1 hypothetical protein PF002_g24732 [Phytophthora fragariae]